MVKIKNKKTVQLDCLLKEVETCEQKLLKRRDKNLYPMLKKYLSLKIELQKFDD